MDYILYHHGIKGQKWGKRNGPPYPLKESDRSSYEKKLEKSSSKENQSNEGKEKYKSPDRQKRASKTGAAAVKKYGSRRIKKSKKSNEDSDDRRQMVRDILKLCTRMRIRVTW